MGNNLVFTTTKKVENMTVNAFFGFWLDGWNILILLASKNVVLHFYCQPLFLLTVKLYSEHRYLNFVYFYYSGCLVIIILTCQFICTQKHTFLTISMHEAHICFKSNQMIKINIDNNNYDVNY